MFSGISERERWIEEVVKTKPTRN